MVEPGWSAAAVARLLGGVLDGADRLAARVTIDSREDCAGALFVALRGRRFDGHDYVGEAVDRGAVAAVIERSRSGPGGATLIRVDDTLDALQRLGAARRDEFPGKVIAITGSSGKTTTRAILTSILETAGATHRPRDNFNNHVGVPLTLLGLRAEHRFAVLELGCSGFGEIAALTAMARPDLGLVTNVGPAHLEQLGDLDGVARAKGELPAGLGAAAVVLLNADDPRVLGMRAGAERRVTFGRDAAADVRLIDRRASGVLGQALEIEARGERFEARLPLLGEHNALNAVAAAAAALCSGLPVPRVAEGLGRAARPPGRLCPLPGPRGSLVLDDTYNANPASTRAALEVLAELAAPPGRIAVLADMLELGERAVDEHRGIGAATAALEPAALVTMGAMGAEVGRGAVAAGLDPARVLAAGSHAEARGMVEPLLHEGTVVLLKGSRGMRMERLAALLAEGGA